MLFRYVHHACSSSRYPHRSSRARVFNHLTLSSPHVISNAQTMKSSKGQGGAFHEFRRDHEAGW